MIVELDGLPVPDIDTLQRVLAADAIARTIEVRSCAAIARLMLAVTPVESARPHGLTASGHRRFARRGACATIVPTSFGIRVTTMLDRDGYRPNVAIVIVNARNQVFWGKRIREHSWQFPQGGINPGETPEQAMYRELREEVGLEPQHVKVLGRTREWLRYDVPQHWIKREWRGSYRGQKQIWYLLRLVGRDNDVSLRAIGASRVRRVAVARVLDPARDGDRVQARVVPARAARARAVPACAAADSAAAALRRAASGNARLVRGPGDLGLQLDPPCAARGARSHAARSPAARRYAGALRPNSRVREPVSAQRRLDMRIALIPTIRKCR